MDRAVKAKKRIKILFFFIVFMYVSILARAIYIDQFMGDNLRAKRINQSKRIVTLYARRGYILDRNGSKLALDVPYSSVYAIPSIITKNDEYAEKLSGILGEKKSEIISKLSKKDSNFVWLRRMISEDAGEKTRDLGLKGIGVAREAKRVYPNDSLAAGVVGFKGEDRGIEGVEYVLDNLLRGEDGMVLLEKDLKGRNIPNSIHERKPARNGSDVYLTIDISIQHFAEQELEKTIKKYSARAGSIVVLDPKSGRVYAMATYPTFNPNNFSAYSKAPERYRNRVISSNFEPGSVMKPIVVAAAIDRGIIDPYKAAILCEPTIQIGSWTIGETHADGLPAYKTPMDVITHSYNTGAARIALKMKKELLRNTFEEFHFGSKYDIQLNGQESGILRSLKEMNNSRVANNGYGHGIAVTQLQMAMASAALINGGLLIQPGVVEKVIDPEGEVIYSFEPKVIKRVISEETSKLMKHFMHMTVEEGTGKDAKIEGYSLGGKTGTARVPARGGGYLREYISSFVGFGPVEDPRLLAMVTIERPKGSYYGSVVAVPAFREVMKKSLWHLDVPANDLPGSEVGY
ncbi:MAG TPA: penicillin-binding protein 2 [bacterium]|nr:penicillin-binding protein 2 [bacterium]